MQQAAILGVGAGLLALAGCGALPNDPAVIGRSTGWFRHTDPAAFFVQEQRHDRVYFIGLDEPDEGGSPVPGVRRDEPAYRLSRTWFLLPSDDTNPVRHQRFVDAARDFARRYNPLVLAYLREHPTAK